MNKKGVIIKLTVVTPSSQLVTVSYFQQELWYVLSLVKVLKAGEIPHLTVNCWWKRWKGRSIRKNTLRLRQSWDSWMFPGNLDGSQSLPEPPRHA